MMEGIFLLLGTNLGDRRYNLANAKSLIAEKIGEVITTSSIYETAAWGKTDQPSFYNQVLIVNSSLQPQHLLGALNQIEEKMGRIRKEKWAERLIDIDILYYGKLILATNNLIIPHPKIADRKFTLIPLIEIAPDFIHPKLKYTNEQLLKNCQDNLEVRKVD